MIVSGERSSLGPVLTELAVLHSLMKGRGYQDFSAAVLATGLADTGRPESATELLLDYFANSRRERIPPSTSLVRIAEKLGVLVNDVVRT